MNISSQEKINKLVELHTAQVTELGKLKDWQERLRGDIRTTQQKLANATCPYKEGDTVLRKQKGHKSEKCVIVRISYSHCKQGYKVVTKKVKSNGSLSSTLVVLHDSSKWRLVL